MRKTPLKELGLMMLLGDSVAGVIQPRKHCQRWKFGPRPYRRMIQSFVDRPGLTRAVSVAGVLAGVWLLTRLDTR